MIECENIAKTYYIREKQPGVLGSLKGLFYSKKIAKHALKNISFKVKPGEIVGLIGANGAGKTTLVKILSGIMESTNGSALVLNHIPSKRHSDFKRQISVIMGQKAQLWWDLPAEDCFRLLRDIYEIPEAEFVETKQELVSHLEVESLLRTPIRNLSLGERMKMELIAALLHKPRVVFLDEPTIGLDVGAQNAVRSFLKNYQRKYSPCMILTSHYMDDIESLCERVLIVRNGELVYDGLLETIQKTSSEKKKLNITFKEKVSLENLVSAAPLKLDLDQKTSNTFSMQCERKNMTTLVSWLFSNFEIVDLSIEERELAEVIEGVIKGTAQI
jgi:ABC-2 type transport system ATP-binding protein